MVKDYFQIWSLETEGVIISLRAKPVWKVKLALRWT